ncbi:hypothetical protein C8F01DRAFT_1164900 [Mycena amicta]|nr:hypothetical protein C8F01DRAFT_1164900 [Mycena amicta]
MTTPRDDKRLAEQGEQPSKTTTKTTTTASKPKTKEEPQDSQIIVSQMSVSPGDVGGTMSTISFHTASGRPRSPKPRTRNSAERRASHNAVERHRRETLNARFLDLAGMLPSLGTIRRPSKSSIVNTSIAHVNASHRHRALATQQLRVLTDECESLRREVNEWRERAGGIAPIPTPVRGETFELLLSGAEPEMDEMYWQDGMEEDHDGDGERERERDVQYSHSPEDMEQQQHAQAQAQPLPLPQQRHHHPQFAYNMPPPGHPQHYDEHYPPRSAPPFDTPPVMFHGHGHGRHYMPRPTSQPEAHPHHQPPEVNLDTMSVEPTLVHPDGYAHSRRRPHPLSIAIPAAMHPHGSPEVLYHREHHVDMRRMSMPMAMSIPMAVPVPMVPSHSLPGPHSHHPHHHPAHTMYHEDQHQHRWAYAPPEYSNTSYEYDRNHLSRHGPPPPLSLLPPLDTGVGLASPSSSTPTSQNQPGSRPNSQPQSSRQNTR